MPNQYFIVDNVTSEPDRYVEIWNPSTGLVTSTSTDDADALDFGTFNARAAAISLINSNPANAGFIGHVPLPPKH